MNLLSRFMIFSLSLSYAALTILVACNQIDKLAIVTGVLEDRKGNRIDSVQYKIYVDGKLRKSEHFGDTLYVYDNEEKVGEVEDGINYTDSTGKFGIPILLQTTSDKTRLSVVFEKENYEKVTFNFEQPFTLDTTIIMERK